MDKLIYDDNCPTCCFISGVLQKHKFDNLEFVPASKFKKACYEDIDVKQLRVTLHYIPDVYGSKIAKNAEACLYVLSNFKYCGFLRFIYFWPIKYLFDLAYYILKLIRKLKRPHN